MNTPSPISLLIAALGGEGGGVLTEWLMDVARHAGHAAQATSIPGVAQRTGATTYYIEVFPQPLSELGGRRPVFSLNPVPGALDALVSSEFLETGRQITLGLPSAQRTLVISSSSRTLTTMERMEPGDGRVSDAQLYQLVREFSRAHHVFDMAETARQAGTVVSAVMLGAIAGSGLLPFARSHYEAVIRASGKGAEASLRGFAAAFDRVAQSRQQADFVAQLLPGESVAPADAGRKAPPECPQAGQFPPAVRELFQLGHARLRDYQGQTYADLYVQRLLRVLQAEQQADPRGAHDHAITREMARWLALWMAFDDVVRVAHLKSRATRWRRVAQEVGAGEHDLLKVYDHFKPGVPEFAALLPAGLARRLLHWDQRRLARGLPAWSLPLKIGTHSVLGMAALRLLASARFLRPHGSRFQQEQRLIEQWLEAVVRGADRSWTLAHEIALCGRLIKGYGSTNERGKNNLLHILEHLAPAAEASQAAQAVALARQAALADEAGKALDAVLVQHGAPKRPVREVPIQWRRQPRALDGRTGKA